MILLKQVENENNLPDEITLNMETEICSACHPFYTGKAKLVDVAGRVDRFRARLEKTATIKGEKQNKF